jgi:hypothetical protein
MNNGRKLVCALIAVTAGCVTSEPIDVRFDAGTIAIMSSTGAAGTVGTAGQSGVSTAGNAGTAGVNASGAAGTTGIGGGVGGAGAGGSTGQAGGGGVARDAGAPETAMTTPDARPPQDAATGEVAAYSATWTDIYNRMLNNPFYPSNCTGAPCHNPGTQKGLDLSTQSKGYTTVKGKLSVGNPNGSSIVSQLSGGKMPQGRPKMPAADLNVIKAWITAGALNN